MYHKFNYKLLKLTLITFTSWLPRRKKKANKLGIIKKISEELCTTSHTKF